MDTSSVMYTWVRWHLHMVEPFRRDIAAALKHLRCGYVPEWYMVHYVLKYMEKLVAALRYRAQVEVQIMNMDLQAGQQRKAYRKPRFYKKNAPPMPRTISLADQETFLEGVLRWFDAMVAAVEAPPGECYPHLPPGLKAVLQRSGFDPHQYLAPRRLIRIYFY